MTRGAMSDGARVARVAVLIPVKAFVDAKQRLGATVEPAARAALARRMAEAVVRAAAPLPVAVICADREVAVWARAQEAIVLEDPHQGLSAAVHAGVLELGARGFGRVIVAHADLPRARSLAWVGDFDGITLVPDRHDDGTNVIAVPTSCTFEFAYGPGSFARHLEEASRTGLGVRVARDGYLALDIDTPQDLACLASHGDADGENRLDNEGNVVS